MLRNDDIIKVHMPAHLVLRINKKQPPKSLSASPWVYAGDIVESSEQALAAPGELAELRTHKDEFLGIGYFNAKSQIAFRLLTTKREAIDLPFFTNFIQHALEFREARYPGGYYRLIHSEGDGLPGLVADRFGDTLVLQISTAGMEKLTSLAVRAFEQVIAPKTIVLRNDMPARTKEGLKEEVRILKGEVPELIEVHENGCIYLADLLKGQKTGWFYDMRDNRARVAAQAKGKTVLDIYCHSGGFGIAAARAGAKEVTFSDRSELALSLAKKAAEKNSLRGARFLPGEAPEVMEKLKEEGRRFDIVIADPPPFIREKRHIEAGMKGYEKVARLASPLVAPGGLLFIASCSHHATPARFRSAVLAGLKQAGRKGRIVSETGASADHPVHPSLPQGAYLKALFIQCD
jgi:23S rRNA (cytosine1962-C5)-methyltransferase